MTFRTFRFLGFLLSLGLMQAVPAQLALAETLGVVAIANDVPITELDVTQRISLMKILDDLPEKGLSRKMALQSIVDDVVKLAEAKRLKMAATDAEISKQVANMAKAMNSTPAGLATILAKQGISEETFRRYVAASVSFNRILGSKYRADVVIKPEDVDAKLAEIQKQYGSRLAEIKSDPRMKAVSVYTIMEINLPVEKDDAMAAQLMQARAIEAMQVAGQFTSCKNARAAASGVFNVKFGKPIEADAAKLPKPMKAALDKVGPGKVIGPMRGKDGIQLLAFCGSRKITPQVPKFEMPTRQQVENALINEKYSVLEEIYMKEARSKIYVEYRNPGYTQ